MTETSRETEREWAREQIEKYRVMYQRYVMYSQTLQQVLEKAARFYAPLGIVQTRPKSIASFAEKAQRKKHKYRDPVNRMTDLCGGRVITQSQSDLEAMCEFIVKHFDIDWDNSVDVARRLKPTEFGYRSVHYVVKFKPGVFPNKDIDIAIPETVFVLKAEIQVRTLLEHAWAVFSHERVYKGEFVMPEKWQRELAGLAAMLEEADQAFSRIHTGLETYAATYGAYMSEEQMRDEIALLEIVLGCEPQNAELAHRIGKMAMTLGDWTKAIAVFSKYEGSGYQPIMRDLGVALCKVHWNDPNGDSYRKGQKYLEEATAPPNKDADALASLAGTWKAIDEERARTLYRKAFEADPSDPYALSNYLVFEISYRRDTSLVSLVSPAIGVAMKRSRDQADVGMNLPWAFYNMGMFHLLLGELYESLASYAKAIQLSTNDWTIETSLRLLDRLAVVRDALPGYDSVRKLLLIARTLKFPSDDTKEKVSKLASVGYAPPPAPVVFVVGGSDASVEQQMQSYRTLVIEAFKDFKGTIISGGTTAGISGLVGDAQKASPDMFTSIGYVPRFMPANTSIDKRYREIRYTEASDFSALESLQAWTDLIASGVDPSQVKVIGINGGAIAAVEYRIALAFGARVAVVEGSGREAAKLLIDADWRTLENLMRLPADPMTARAFIGSGTARLESSVRESVARSIHAAYRKEEASRKASDDPSLAEWDGLLDDLKESNRQQADHIFEKLKQIGCTTHKAESKSVEILKFSDADVEKMAEMEHARWVVERLGDGWTWGEKRDAIRKINPYLVPWSELADDVKEWDRETVRKIPEFLAQLGIEIRRK